MRSPIILSRVPFRLPLGGGSTDIPSYYEEHGGFIFSVTIDLYMDVLFKEPVVDDYIHMHYTHYETEAHAENIKHTIGREALRMTGTEKKVLISFNADTPSGTGLGSSGACSVALLKGLSLYRGHEMSNLEAAEQSFVLTQNLGLPDGKQDPYVCAIGGFVTLDIAKNGDVKVDHPKIAPETKKAFTENTLLFYTGVRRDSKFLLSAQGTKSALELKHEIKKIGQEVYDAFVKGDLDIFGHLMDTHWKLKRGMTGNMTSEWLDEIYTAATSAGALGGKIIGAGGGGYFMFYCPSESARKGVRQALHKFNMRELSFDIDELGARTQVINF